MTYEGLDDQDTFHNTFHRMYHSDVEIEEDDFGGWWLIRLSKWDDGPWTEDSRMKIPVMKSIDMDCWRKRKRS